jgi:hypothetical protein
LARAAASIVPLRPLEQDGSPGRKPEQVEVLGLRAPIWDVRELGDEGDVLDGHDPVMTGSPVSLRLGEGLGARGGRARKA